MERHECISKLLLATIVLVKKSALLISTKNDLHYASRRQANWDYFIASHHELYCLAKDKNLSVLENSSLVNPHEYHEYTSLVANTLFLLGQLLGDKCHSNFKSILLGQLARKLYLYQLFVKNNIQNGHKIFFRDDKKRIIPLNWATSSKALFSNIHLNTKIPEESYALDFQSASGHKTGIFNSNNKRLSIIFSREANVLANYFNHKKNKILISVPKKPLHDDVVTLELLNNNFNYSLSKYLFEKITLENKIFTSHYSALEKTFRQARLPCEVFFNYVKDTRMAACMAFFGDHGVKISMQSHGALHVFGNLHEKEITRALSNSIYNYSPSVSELFLRSTLQADGLPNQISPKIKPVTPVLNLKRNAKFKILIAPNFTNWSETPWGIHTTCFDVVSILKHLAKLMHRTDDIDWSLRLKFSLSDVPSRHDRNKIQGLGISKIKEIFHGIKNFNDDSLKSYQRCIAESDIVITEGLTTVPYDAWENRIPVLFLRSSKSVRGLQRAKDESIDQYTKRSAYHSQSCENFSLLELYELKNMYWRKPLTDTELESVLKVK